MYKKIIACIIGVVLLTTPLVYAVDLNYESPIDITEDNYIRFGNDEYPQREDYLMSIYPDASSISAQWIDITFQINEPGLIDFKEIDKFLILANGKIVDYVYPQYEVVDSNVQYAETYLVKPSIPELTGTDVYFQVVAVSYFGSAQSAVAWTGYSGVFIMDDFPVKDEEAVGILWSINQKLENLSEKIETMFTPSPEALARFEEAQQKALEFNPVFRVSEKTTETSLIFVNTHLDPPVSKLTFGEKRDWLGIGFEFYLLDFTGLEKEIKLMRDFLDAVIWIQFFIFILFYLSPRLDL